MFIIVLSQLIFVIVDKCSVVVVEAIHQSVNISTLLLRWAACASVTEYKYCLVRHV